MEFINISDIKLKVVLSEKERASFGIDTAKSDFSGVDVRRAIRGILSVAESECGFKADGTRILVQLYPLPDGRCELLVTKMIGVSTRDRAALSASDGVTVMEQKRGTFRFENADDLFRAAKAVQGYKVDADLYLDDLGRYYISAREDIADGFSELDVLTEFGDRLTSMPMAVLSEYGTLMARGNALTYVLSDEFIDPK